MAIPTTPTKGHKNSNMAGAPSGGAVQVLLLVQVPFGPGWSFRGKQNLTLARHSVVMWPLMQPLHFLIFLQNMCSQPLL